MVDPNHYLHWALAGGIISIFLKSQPPFQRRKWCTIQKSKNPNFSKGWWIVEFLVLTWRAILSNRLQRRKWFSCNRIRKGKLYTFEGRGTCAGILILNSPSHSLRLYHTWWWSPVLSSWSIFLVGWYTAFWLQDPNTVSSTPRLTLAHVGSQWPVCNPHLDGKLDYHLSSIWIRWKR